MKKVFALLLAVLMLSTLSLTVFADTGAPETTRYPSREGETEFQVEIIYEVTEPIEDRIQYISVPDGDTFTFTARDIPGYEFERFDIDGEYEIISQDGRTIVVKPHGDLVVHVRFRGVTPQPVPDDHGQTSPHTGDNTILVVGMMLLGLCGVVVSTKKLVKSR